MPHQPVEVPVLGVTALAVLVDAFLDDLAHVAEDVAARVRGFEDLPAVLVHDLPLLVHHVVVLDDVLAGVEVHSLDLLLRAGDRSRDPRMLDRLDLEAVHQPAYAVGGRPEDLHQVVLERDEEAAGPRVALAPGTTAKLVVDAAAFMSLGADDVQPADVRHAFAGHDVRAATRHIGGDGDRARLTGLRDHRGLALVLLRVEHVVLDASPDRKSVV